MDIVKCKPTGCDIIIIDHEGRGGCEFRHDVGRRWTRMRVVRCDKRVSSVAAGKITSVVDCCRKAGGGIELIYYLVSKEFHQRSFVSWEQLLLNFESHSKTPNKTANFPLGRLTIPIFQPHIATAKKYAPKPTVSIRRSH